MIGDMLIYRNAYPSDCMRIVKQVLATYDITGQRCGFADDEIYDLMCTSFRLRSKESTSFRSRS